MVLDALEQCTDSRVQAISLLLKQPRCSPMFDALEQGTELRVQAISPLLKPPRCSPVTHCLNSELTRFFCILFGKFSAKITK